MLGNLCLYSAEARYLQSKLVSWLICPGYSVPYNPISSKNEVERCDAFNRTINAAEYTCYVLLPAYS